MFLVCTVPAAAEIEQFVDVSLYRERAQASAADAYLNDEQKQLFNALQNHTILQEQKPPALSASTRESLNNLEYLRGLQAEHVAAFELLQTFCTMRAMILIRWWRRMWRPLRNTPGNIWLGLGQKPDDFFLNEK